jgi:hypothetical protein
LLVPCSVPRLLYVLYGEIGLIITSLLYSLSCNVIVRFGSATSRDRRGRQTKFNSSTKNT